MSAEALVQQRLDSLTKPPGSLGRLERLLLAWTRITGAPPPRQPRAAALVFCADHGVVAEGVSRWPQAVSWEMACNLASGGAAMSVLCRHYGIALTVIDAGLATGGTPPGVVAARIAPGTRNFAREPALTPGEAEAALRLGRRTAATAAIHADVLLCGEMGIGNTTAATALLCAYTGCPPQEVAGPGAGLDQAGIAHKAAVIGRAIASHHVRSPLAIAATFGGLEILAIAGVILEAASRRMPVLLDGLIACSAALIVQALEPEALGAVLYSHRSSEPGHTRMLAALGAPPPLLDLDLRLGEGTGAALAFGLLQAACRLYHEMATFGSAGVSGPHGASAI